MRVKYDNEFKQMIVNLIVNEKQSTSKIAKQFNVSLKTVEKWITAYNKNKKIFNSNYKSDEQIIAEQKREIEHLKRNNEILKKTISLLANKE